VLLYCTVDITLATRLLQKESLPEALTFVPCSTQSTYNSAQYLLMKFLYFIHIWLIFWGKLRNSKTAFVYTPLAYNWEDCLELIQHTTVFTACSCSTYVHILKCVQPWLQSLPDVDQSRSMIRSSIPITKLYFGPTAPTTSPTDNFAILLITLSARKLRRPNNTTAGKPQFVISTSARWSGADGPHYAQGRSLVL
jgi:hypothetical protein